MTIRNPPSVLQAGSHPAEHDRLLFEMLFGKRAGILEPTDLAVSENGTPNMSVNVAAGHCIIDGTESAHQGVYHGYNDATVNLAISAADATNPRKDLVIARIRDAAYSGGTNTIALEVVTGTPTAGLVAGDSTGEPTLPANSLRLARVFVAAADTAIGNSEITDQRVRSSALNAPIVCTSSTRPSSPRSGQFIWETDTTRLLMYDGSTWQRISHTGTTGRTGCRLRRAANQSLTAGTTTDISFDTEDFDSDGFIAVTSTLITIPAGLGGLYTLNWKGDPAAHPGFVGYEVIAGGIAYKGQCGTGTSAELGAHFTLGPIALAAADTIAVGIHPISTTTNWTARAELYRIGA